MLSSLTPYIIAVAPLATAILAQAEVQSVAHFGILGAVLAWFMVRAEKLLAKIEHKMVGMNKTMLIWLLEAPTTSRTAKRMCREELRRLDPQLAEEMIADE